MLYRITSTEQYARIATDNETLPSPMYHMPFDRGVFRADVLRVNPSAKVLELSVAEDIGIDEWIAWVAGRLRARRLEDSASRVKGEEAEWYFG